MTHCHSPTDPHPGQSAPDASPGRMEVELKVTESAAPGWSRLWAWLLAPSDQDSADEGADDRPRK